MSTVPTQEIRRNIQVLLDSGISTDVLKGCLRIRGDKICNNSIAGHFNIEVGLVEAVLYKPASRVNAYGLFSNQLRSSQSHLFVGQGPQEHSRIISQEWTQVDEQTKASFKHTASLHNRHADACIKAWETALAECFMTLDTRNGANLSRQAQREETRRQREQSAERQALKKEERKIANLAKPQRVQTPQQQKRAQNNALIKKNLEASNLRAERFLAKNWENINRWTVVQVDKS